MQSHSLRNALRTYTRLLPLFALLLLAACGNNNAAGTTAAALPPAGLTDALPDLPWEHPAPRSVRVIEEQTQDGSAAIQQSPGAVDEGSSLAITSAARTLEHGMYQFALGGNDPVNFNANLAVTAGNQAWIGAANFTRGRWDFFGPFAIDPGNRPLTGEHASPAGNVYLLVIAWDGTELSVADITLSSDDGVIPPGGILGNVTVDGGNGLPGVTMTLSPGGDTELTDIVGNYAFSDILPGNYTLTPSLNGFSFEPESVFVQVVSGEDASAQVILASDDTAGPGISGKVMNGDTPLAGVKVTYIRYTGVNSIVQNIAVTTDAGGNYSFPGLSEGTYRVIPLLAGFAFTPNIMPITVDGAEVQDFAAQAVTIPATVTYNAHMRPWLFEPICMNCHHSQYGTFDRNGAAPAVNWDTYLGTSELNKGRGNLRVQQNSMPPLSFLPQTRTTTFQQELFQAWLDDGFPES